MTSDFVYLASASPRRRELLTQIGVAYRLLDAQVDEVARPGEAAAVYVERLARAKAAARRPADAAHAPVLGADTAVVLDGRILGKPADADDGARMLEQLSGRAHEVLTAVAVAGATGTASRVSRSEVTFRRITAEEARAYWASGEPADKAGGYAIQGRAAVFVERLVGSYSGVMGLPLFETAQLLAAAGVPVWRAA